MMRRPRSRTARDALSHPRFLDERLAHSLGHARRRALHLDSDGLAGLEHALDARQDLRPADAATLKDRVRNVPGVRLDHCELHGLARDLYVVTDEALRQIAVAGQAFNTPGGREASRRLPVNHFTLDMDLAVRRLEPKDAADLRLDLDDEAEEVLPRERWIGQRLPDLLRRRSDIDNVHRPWLELRN